MGWFRGIASGLGAGAIRSAKAGAAPAGGGSIFTRAAPSGKIGLVSSAMIKASGLKKKKKKKKATTVSAGMFGTVSGSAVRGASAKSGSGRNNLGQSSLLSNAISKLVRKVG